MTIGQRAAEQIKKTAKEQGITISQEMQNLGGDRKNYYDWGKRDMNPTACFLEQMHYLDYDVIYILTGERSVRCKDCASKEPCDIKGKVWCKRMGRYMKENGYCSEGCHD